MINEIFAVFVIIPLFTDMESDDAMGPLGFVWKSSI